MDMIGRIRRLSSRGKKSKREIARMALLHLHQLQEGRRVGRRGWAAGKGQTGGWLLKPTVPSTESSDPCAGGGWPTQPPALQASPRKTQNGSPLPLLAGQ